MNRGRFPGIFTPPLMGHTMPMSIWGPSVSDSSFKRETGYRWPHSTARRSRFRECFPHLRDGLDIEAGCRQFVVRGGSDIRQAAILFEQAGPFDLADADDLIQLRGHQGFAAQLAMECNRKSMGLVTNALHEMGGRGVRAKHDGVFSTGQERSARPSRRVPWPIQ